MKKNKVKLGLLIGVIAIIGVIVVFFVARKDDKINNKNTMTSEQKESYNQSMDILNNAKTIVITKDLVSLGKSYDIEIDGKDFGDMDGEFIKVTGDTFTITNKDDVVLASEKQIKRWGIKINRLAEIKNSNDEAVGYIGEEKLEDLFKMGFNFHFYNKNKEEVGYLKQEVFNILDTFKIYNMNNELCYEIKANFSPIVAKYTITVYNSKAIPVDQAIFMTGIINSVKSGKEAENSKLRKAGVVGVGVAIDTATNSKNKTTTNSNEKENIDIKAENNTTEGSKNIDKDSPKLDLNKKPQTNTKKPNTSTKKSSAKRR